MEEFTYPILNVAENITQWFGTPNNTVVVDICILFSYLILFVFVLSIFGLLFKRWK